MGSGASPRAPASPGPWWIGGGWALEAFTGLSRPHDDLDVCVSSTDVPEVVTTMSGRPGREASTDGELDVTRVTEDLIHLLPTHQPQADLASAILSMSSNRFPP